MAKRIQLRRDLNANWENRDPILAQGEIGIDISTKNFKIGDGQSSWNNLDYAIVSGKLGRINADTYIETGEADNEDTIYFVNDGDTTVELSPDLAKVYIATLFSGDIPSTNPFDGTVVVDGGVGISGDLNVGGTITGNDLQVNSATIASTLNANLTGNVFGNLVSYTVPGQQGTFGGRVISSTGDIVLNPGSSNVPPLYSGNVNGNINSQTGSFFKSITIEGGNIDGTVIGLTNPANITGAVIKANTKFEGNLHGKLLGDVYADDGTTLILDNTTTGKGPTFYGRLVGSTSGDFRGDIFADESNRKVLENGRGNLPSDPNYDPAVFTGNVAGNITSNGVSTFANIEVNSGRIDNTVIGKNIPAGITGTTITATELFIGQFQGVIAGTTTGDIRSTNGILILENGDLGTDAHFVGEIRAQDGTTKVLENGTGGLPTDLAFLPARFTGNVVGNLTGNVTANNIDTATLNTTDDVSITGNLFVDGSGEFTGNITAPNLAYDGATLALASTNFTVQTGTGDTSIAGDLTVGGSASIGVDLTVTGNFNVDGITANDINSGTVTTTGNISVGDDLDVTNDLAVGGNVNVVGSVSANDFIGNISDIGNIKISGNTIESINGEINISTATNLDYINITSKTFKSTPDLINGISNFDLTGNVVISKDLDVNGGNINTSAASVNLVNTNATTINFGAAATLIEIGSGLGLTNINHELIVDGNASIGANLTVTGNLSVQGTLAYINTTNTEIKDNIIILNKGEQSIGVTSGYAGIEVDRGPSPIPTSWLKWNESTDTWEFGLGTDPAALKIAALDTLGNVNITGTLDVTEDVTFDKDLTVKDITADNITTTGNVNVGSDLRVDGDVQFIGDLVAANIDATSLDLTGNATIGGTLDVTGLSTLATVDINGGNIDGTKIGEAVQETIKATGVEATSLDIKNEGEIRLFEDVANGLTYVGLKAPTEFIDSYTLTLPNVRGVDGSILSLNRNGDKLEFVSADLFGGGQVAVSADYGDDTFDGINKPVKTIKRALQIASGLVYDSNKQVNEKRIVITVASGEYYEDNPIIIPDNVSVVGAGLRACNIRPLNNDKDMLRVRNGCYFTEITFRDALDANKRPDFTFNYAVAFDDPSDTDCSRVGYINLPTTKPVISISPYIQNCSIISFLGGNGVLVDGRKVLTPNRPKNPLEVESALDFRPGVPQQGKSMVANAFTMLSFGGTGWRVINDAYAQIVSCFQIFCLNGSYCQSGGYLSITNSATNFGQYALRSSGYSPNAFDFNRGYIVGYGSILNQDVITAIGFKELPTQHYVVRIRTPIYRQAYDIILANKEELADEIEIWIDAQVTGNIAPFTSSFTYNVSKCKRDVGIVLDAVAYDVLSGGNSKTVEAGLSYANQSVTLTLQKTQNIAAFQRLRDLVVILVNATTLGSYVSAKFDIVTDIINDPTVAPEPIEYSNLGDITSDFKTVIAGNEISFNAALVNAAADSIIFSAPHGLLNLTKIDYSNEGNASIPGLDDEQSYYADVISATELRLWTDESKTKLVDIRGIGTGTHKLIKSRQEYFIDDLVSYHKDYQKLTLTSNTYTFNAGQEILGTTGNLSNRAYVYSWDKTTRELIVSIDTDSLSASFGASSLIVADHSGGTFVGGIPLTSAVNLDDYYTARFKILPTAGGIIPNAKKPDLLKKQIWLHRPSIVNSSGHTWEYAGSGIDYNALPQNGGTTNVEYEQVSEIPGRVYSSGTNELGDFKVGDFIKAENKTGNVQFTNTVSIAELDALKLSIGNIQINEFSSDIDLGDNEPGGPKDTRLSTQKAVRSFLGNRLGFFIDREVSTTNLAGAVPQLNTLGLLSPEVIPPIRNFLVFKTLGYRSRLGLTEYVPANNVLPGDLNTETYSTVDLTLTDDSTGANTNKITASDGDLVTQSSTGAIGYLIGNVIGARSITVASKDKLFSVYFNKTDPITINSVNYTLSTSVVSLTVLTDQTTNYILSEQDPGQFLVLDPAQSYNFSSITSIRGAITQAQGTIDSTNYPPNGIVLGVIRAVDVLGMTLGTGYVNGTYTNVPLIGNTGTGATGDFTVIGGSVTTFSMRSGGKGYTVSVSNKLGTTSLPLTSGGAGGFAIAITDIENRLYVKNVGGIKFSDEVEDFIQDSNAPSQSITQNYSFDKVFNATTDIDTTAGTITIANHGYSNGDPVRYSRNGFPDLGNIGISLEDGFVYYVKVLNANTIELYSNYALLPQQKVPIPSTETGTHKLITVAIDYLSENDPPTSRFYFANHGYTTGTSVRITPGPGSILPSTIDDGKIYYIGSVTLNSFTLHADKTEADDSLANIISGGITIDPVPLLNIGTGTMILTNQNVKVLRATSTSAKTSINWSSLSSNNIAANNIISGLIDPARLGNGQANSETFLRGDQEYAPVVQKIIKPATSALLFNGTFFNNNGILEHYDTLTMDVDVVTASQSTGAGSNFTNLGVARFNKDQFDVGTTGTVLTGDIGQVTVKSGVIDAGLLDGQDGSFYTDPVNLTGVVPVAKGGTGIGGLVQYAIGDTLYCSSVTPQLLSRLNIGTNNTVMVSNGSTPYWSDSLVLNGLIVNGNLTMTGSAGTLNAYDIKMDDNNIELGSIAPILGRSGIVNYTGTVPLQTEVTASTAGMIPGMTLTKVSGTGNFGADAKVLSIDSATQFTVISTSVPTSGAIVFNTGGATDDTANNGGITIKSTVNKTLNWIKSTSSWTSSENMDLANTKTYKINNVTVLSSNSVLGKELSSGVGKIMTSGSSWVRTFMFMGV